MIKRPSLGSQGLSVPQIALILIVGFLAIATVVLTLRTYFSSTGTATAFEEASYTTTTNLSNIQRESLLLRIETHALFSDFTKGFEPVEYSERDFKPVDLRRDLLSAQLRVATAGVSDNAPTLAELDKVKSTIAKYDSLLTFVRANLTLDDTAAIAQFDEILIQLGRQVKALYDQEENQFFRATAASLGGQKSAKRAYNALEAETQERRQAEQAALQLAEENAMMAGIGRIINSSLNIEEVYPDFADEIGRLLSHWNSVAWGCRHHAGPKPRAGVLVAPKRAHRFQARLQRAGGRDAGAPAGRAGGASAGRRERYDGRNWSRIINSSLNIEEVYPDFARRDW